MKRAIATILIPALASCIAPETARFYGGYWATSEIDNRACHARAGSVQLVVPGGDVPPALVLAPSPGDRSVAPPPPSSPPPSSPPSSRPASPPPAPPPPPLAPPAAAVAGATYKVDIAGVGSFDVAIHAQAGAELEGVSVAADARIGVAVVAPELRPRPVPGFVFGVDLRPYRHIVVVVDNTADMCEFTGPEHKRVILDDVIDQVIASLSGLPVDRRVSLVAASGNVRQLVPSDGDDGRRIAMEWTCGLICEGDSSMTLALVRAFDERPDVVVLLSNGAMPPFEHNGSVGRLPDLASIAADPADAITRMEYTSPVIAIDIGRGANRDRLQRIAHATGGVYVAP